MTQDGDSEQGVRIVSSYSVVVRIEVEAFNADAAEEVVCQALANIFLGEGGNAHGLSARAVVIGFEADSPAELIGPAFYYNAGFFDALADMRLFPS